MVSQDKGRGPGVNIPELAAQMMKDPKLAAQIRQRAEEYASDVKATWPTDDRTVPDSGDFSHKSPGDAFVVIHTEGADGRPVSIVEARHPYAAAHQARTGAFTKAAGSNFNERW